MTLHIPAKVLLHVWSYDFYDMTLSTGKQQRHMIILFIYLFIWVYRLFFIYLFLYLFFLYLSLFI